MPSLLRNRHRRMMLLSGKRSTVLEDAEAYWDLRFYDGGTSLLDMQGRHPAVLGSTAGADSNDPLYLPYAGTPYLYLSGVAGNYASVPDEAALDITGDIDLRAKVALADWTPSGDATLINRDDLGSNRSFRFLVGSGGNSGKLQLYWLNSTVPFTDTSTVVVPAVDGGAVWVRATLDVDDGAGNHVTTFYTGGSGDTPTWVQLGTAVTTAGTTAIDASAVGVTIGETATFNSWAGKVYSTQIHDGIGGTKVLDIDFTDLSKYNAARTSLTAVTGQTVTINRSSTGRKAAVVERNVMLMATDDYLEVADSDLLDFGATDSFTVVFAGRSYGTGTMVYVSKQSTRSITAVGWTLYKFSDGYIYTPMADGTTGAEDGSYTTVVSGVPFIAAMTRNVLTDKIEAFYSGVGSGSPTTDPTTASLANSYPVRIGADAGTAAAFFEGEFFGAAIFRRALTDAEIKRLQYEWAI